MGITSGPFWTSILPWVLLLHYFLLFSVFLLFFFRSSKEDFCQIWQDSGQVFCAAIPPAGCLDGNFSKRPRFLPIPSDTQDAPVNLFLMHHEAQLTYHFVGRLLKGKEGGRNPSHQKGHHKLSPHGWGQRLKSSSFCHLQVAKKHWLDDILFIAVFL